MSGGSFRDELHSLLMAQWRQGFEAGQDTVKRALVAVMDAHEATGADTIPLSVVRAVLAMTAEWPGADKGNTP